MKFGESRGQKTRLPAGKVKPIEAARKDCFSSCALWVLLLTLPARGGRWSVVDADCPQWFGSVFEQQQHVFNRLVFLRQGVK